MTLTLVTEPRIGAVPERGWKITPHDLVILNELVARKTTTKKVGLKGKWIRRKFDNILTMTFRIIIINITVTPFHNDRINVHHNAIKYVCV